jgi:hypothetical protein
VGYDLRPGEVNLIISRMFEEVVRLILSKMESSLRLTSETAIPALPARAVLPILWKYVRGSSGKSKLITWLTFVMSRPLAATSVATRTATDPSRKACIALSL